MTDKDVMKTGTTTVGIVCKDGIILAADRRATAGHLIANKKMKKVIKISDYLAVTIAGLVSDAQLLSKLIKAELKLRDIQTGRVAKVKEAANLLGGMLYYNIRRMSMVPGIVAFLVGGRDKDGFHLYELGIDGSVTEVDDFVSDGSGSVFALGVLETLYKKNMSMEEGIQLVTKAINAALQRDNASGDGLTVMTITEKGVQEVVDKQLQTKLEA